jgi:hypothetical protein
VRKLTSSRSRLALAVATLFATLTVSMLAGMDGVDSRQGRHSAAAPELEALEFLLGDWDLTTSFAQAGGSRRESKAQMTARWAIGGFGIAVEETHGYAQVESGIFVNTTLYTVHPETRRIVGASINTLGNRKNYEVTVEDDRLVIVQAGELFRGREGFNRHVLFNITSDRYERRLDSCVEEGEACTEGTYSYVAQRRSAED